MSSDDPYQITPDMDLTAYYKTISAKGKEVMRQRRALGQCMNRPPLGYQIVYRLDGPYLEPDPQTYPLVEEARRLHESGLSIRKVLRVMTSKGLKTKRGRALSVAGMAGILARPELPPEFLSAFREHEALLK